MGRFLEAAPVAARFPDWRSGWDFVQVVYWLGPDEERLGG